MNKLRTATAVLALVALAVLLYLQPPSTLSVVALCMLLAAALILAASAVSSRAGQQWKRIAATTKDLVPIVTIVAIAIAAGFFFLERRDRFRLSFNVETSVVGLGDEEELGKQKALLTVRAPVENRSSRQLEIDCMSIDVLQPEQVTLARRVGQPEMALERIRENIAYADPNNCFPERGDRPLFLWEPLVLEPNDAGDRYFEVTLDCDKPIARVEVKLRVNPRDSRGYESRAVVPLASACTQAGGTTSIRSEPVIIGADSSSSAYSR